VKAGVFMDVLTLRQQAWWCTPLISVLEAEAGGSLVELEASLGYTARPYQKKERRNEGMNDRGSKKGRE
jgi:hypothetical protein